ncbi:hypothetical protein EZ449_17865 [Pedobacter frigidisoli]|uniref:Uncharacterized protein n=1 Tax=Pedobacter frigidisoli TaxID=2530455 RepID=A0A4R0NTA1_9SPHI|nr:hypothetical protein [Pedobacter frigidisoli]TCD04176.1 hypothetical protein EZ449_17865 [Pedobacter frigidisoli]
METINLQNDLNLSFEKLPHTIRLIISKNNEEWVCRKEKLKKLFSFAEVDKERLFKGRLQLLKSDDKIDIQVKSELIGAISNEAFKKALRKLK